MEIAFMINVDVYPYGDLSDMSHTLLKQASDVIRSHGGTIRHRLVSSYGSAIIYTCDWDPSTNIQELELLLKLEVPCIQAVPKDQKLE